MYITEYYKHQLLVGKKYSKKYRNYESKIIRWDPGKSMWPRIFCFYPFFYERSLRTTASPTDSLLPTVINVRKTDAVSDYE